MAVRPLQADAHLRAAEELLDRGEAVLNVLMGDTQHWQIFHLSTGPSGATPIVGVRPMVGLEFAETRHKSTNLVVTTDRRIYNVLIELPPCSPAEAVDPNPHRSYHRQLSFYYPDDLISRWHSRSELSEIQEQARRSRRPCPMRRPSPQASRASTGAPRTSRSRL